MIAKNGPDSDRFDGFVDGSSQTLQSSLIAHLLQCSSFARVRGGGEIEDQIIARHGERRRIWNDIKP